MKIFYNNLKVTVTGGCGFIGSHLAIELVNLGARVTIIDDLSTGNLENIQPIKDKITFINKSITDYQACLEATKNAEVIFHLAAFISVPLSLEQPQLCHETNVNGLVNILEAARINGVKRLTFSSSAAVYGTNEDVCSESTATNPQSPYGYTKLIGELYCQQYAKNFGINTVILRYFNVYGPRQNPAGSYAAVVATFMDRMKNNLPITIFGNGSQTRDFVPVSQVVQANLNLAIKADQCAGQTFNIATGKSITLLELIEQLKPDFPDYAIDLRFLPARAGDVKSSIADCSKYRQVTDQLHQ
ncbi:MAG: NAD-dependent epimerase/dehydratase family protein [Candidatus Babeliales bacterium]|nr:NAD-dependent epimerase/dehydratase family protein [Candidatus Babeliales bacterium]